MGVRLVWVDCETVRLFKSESLRDSLRGPVQSTSLAALSRNPLFYRNLVV